MAEIDRRHELRCAKQHGAAEDRNSGGEIIAGIDDQASAVDIEVPAGDDGPIEDHTAGPFDHALADKGGGIGEREVIDPREAHVAVEEDRVRKRLSAVSRNN